MMMMSQKHMGKKNNKELENVWMAAHFPKRIKIQLVQHTNIISSVDNILVDQIPFVTYRILGFLLLGVARIYSKKVEYLLVDSNRCMNEIQLYFEGRRKDTVNVAGMCLPESSGNRSKQSIVPVSESSSKKKSNTFIEAMRAQFSSISLPENFELDTFDLEIVEDDSSNDHVKPHLELVLSDAWENDRTGHHRYGKQHGDVYARFSDHASTSSSAMITNFNTSNSGKSAENFRHRFSLEECLDPMVLDETDDEADLSVIPFIEQEPECNTINIPDMTFEDRETSHIHPVEECTTGETAVLEMTSGDNIILKPSPDKRQLSVTVDVTPQSKTPVVLGEHKSDCLAVRTPAPKSEFRLPRKRKCVFDEARKIPNDEYRGWLEDASDLVCKTRRVSSSLLAWKKHLSTDYILEPIIPISAGFPSDLRSVISMKELVVEKEVEETGEPVTELEPLNMDKVPVEREEESIAPSTPVTRSTSLRFHLTPMASQVGPAGSSETGDRDHLRVGGVDLDEVQLEEGPSSLGECNQENVLTAEKWSAVTKSIARHLHGNFVRRKERGEEGALKLSQVLKRKTKKESARFFYQILVLKSGGYIDVKQAKPYDEICVMQTPKLEEVFGVGDRK